MEYPHLELVGRRNLVRCRHSLLRRLNLPMPLLRTCIESSKTRGPDEYAGKVLEVLLTERGEKWCGDTVPEVIPSHHLKEGEFCARS